MDSCKLQINKNLNQVSWEKNRPNRASSVFYWTLGLALFEGTGVYIHNCFQIILLSPY